MDDGRRRKASMTVGIDLGDKYSYLCLIDTESGGRSRPWGRPF
jgi:hypothetical protein